MDSGVEQESTATPSEPEEEELPPPSLEPETFNVQFDINSSSLNEDVRSVLTGAAEIVADHEEFTVTLTGYTDQSGSKAYNEQLAKKRIDAVAEFLIAEGVDDSKIVREVVGEADPALAPAGKDPASWNRRVEVRVE